MAEEQEQITYEWVHPDVITWRRSDQLQGYLFRSWERLSLEFEHFTIDKNRFFRQAPSSLDIVSTYELEKHLEKYNALAR